MDSFRQDLRIAARSLVRTPGFTAIALITLALGIGANTAIFSIVSGVILRPLSYPKPEQLMYLTTQFPALGFDQFWVSPPEYMEFREFNQSFAAVGAFRTAESNLTAGDRPLRARTALVDEHLFAALGVPAAQGRLFAKGEAEVTGPPPAQGQPAPPTQAIVVLSHEFWQSAFGGRSMIGTSIEINGRP
ncbi:MAG TPA: ABC transporter permease, partial [Vicinamibacterales bacterium]